MSHRWTGYRGHLVSVGLGALLCGLSLAGCEGEGDGADEKPPLVGLLELPLSHRNTDKEPSSATRVEIGPGEIRVGSETALTLQGGKVADTDRQGNLLPALKTKLSASPTRALALVVHGATPYATLARVIHTGFESGARELYFQVRKPAATTEAGWMRLSKVRMTDRTDPPVFEPSEMPSWEQFTDAWAEARAGCKEDPAGDCGYVPSVKAKGGKLDMLLRSRGVGISVRFRQFLPEAEATAQAEQEKQEKAAKGPEMLDGIAAPAPKAEEQEDPSTEATFNMRAEQAAQPESPFSAIVQPVCGQEECAAIVESEGISLTARVIALIGAAFPDGTPEPALALSAPQG